jgi:hypothetical protein
MATSREQEQNAIAYAKQEANYAQQAMDEMSHWQAQGVGMATFCAAFVEAMKLVGDEDGNAQFEWSDILALLHTALGGLK